MAMRMKKALPTELQTCIQLNDFEYMLLEMYTDLMTERTVGMDYGYIPRSKIYSIIEFYDFDEEDAWFIYSVLTKLDKAVVESIRNKNGNS